MAAQGGAPFLEKVGKMLSRQGGKPMLKPNRALVLEDTVANRKPRRREATCITELSLLLACWKQNNFSDSPCSNEIDSFYTCAKAAQAARKQSDQTSSQGRFLTPKHATSLLKRYPTHRKEI